MTVVPRALICDSNWMISHAQRAPQQRHAATAQSADVPAVDDYPSGGGEFITVYEAQERGLAGAGWPDHKNKLPRLNAEGDMAERYDTVEKSLCDVLKVDHALLRRIPYQFAWPHCAEIAKLNLANSVRDERVRRVLRR